MLKDRTVLTGEKTGYFWNRILCFVARVSLSNLVNKAKFMDNCLVCIQDSHPYRITSTKCRINRVVAPDDGHIVARNM